MQKLKSNAGKLFGANQQVRLQKKRDNRIKKKHFKMMKLKVKGVIISPAKALENSKTWSVHCFTLITYPTTYHCFAVVL